MATEIWGVVFCVMAAIGILFRRNAVSGWTTRRRTMLWLYVSTAGLLLFDALGWVFIGLPRVHTAAVFCRFFVYLFCIAMVVCSAEFLYASFHGTGHGVRMVWCVRLLAVVDMLLLFISQVNEMLYSFNEINRPHFNRLHILFSGVVVLMMLLMLISLVRGRKYLRRFQFVTLLLLFVLPMIAIVLQEFAVDYPISNLMITVVLLILFTEEQISQTEQFVRQQETIKQQRDRLYELQAQIALSQIKPHFLFNTLNSVRVLIGKNPEEAKEAMDEFSEYLRINISSIDTNRPAPFATEIAFVEAYMRIEKRRFPDKLHLTYDTPVTDFMLPLLTVQPLVENAVRHGIRRTEHGGTIQISTREEENAYTVTVADDGAGFDTAILSEQAESGGHIGIDNVRRRLEIISHGELTICSEIGKGTDVTLWIPKKF